MPAISVVMPVYNTKEYVGKAIQSILDQTFSDFEFLIIDNGSTDGSGDVIARYAQADSRIRVIHNEKNVFIAEARNRALELVQGEYLNLIDSDDWVLPDMLETMYSRAKEHDAQYVVAGYFMHQKKIAILSIPIRMKSKKLCYLMGWGVARFKANFSEIYYTMRASVAQGALRVK